MVCFFVKPYIIPFHRNGCHSFNNKTKRMIDLKKYLFCASLFVIIISIAIPSNSVVASTNVVSAIEQVNEENSTTSSLIETTTTNSSISEDNTESNQETSTSVIPPTEQSISTTSPTSPTESNKTTSSKPTKPEKQKYTPSFSKERLIQRITEMNKIQKPVYECMTFDEFMVYDRNKITNKEMEQLMYDCISQKRNVEGKVRATSREFIDFSKEMHDTMNFYPTSAIQTFWGNGTVLIKIDYERVLKEAKKEYEKYVYYQDLNYNENKKEYDEKIAELNEVVPKIENIMKKLNYGYSQTDAINAIVKYICQNCRYSDSSSEYLGSISDCLNGECVCAGYAKTLSAMLAYIGIDSEYVVGNNGHHAWTNVYVNNKKYLFDLTWYDTDYESKYIWQTENLPTHKEDFCL